MKNINTLILSAVSTFLVGIGSATSQTNVFDDVIALSPNHTSLEAALIQANLDDDLQNPAGTFTVFAPDNAAFDQLATDLGTTVPGLLALPNLADILLYHVLNVEVPSSGVTNGAIVTPLFAGNTLKLTKTGTNEVFVNHAQVNAPDLTTANGVVHSIDAVVLSNETVVDIAIDNGFTSLTAAVVEARLLPALTDPFSTLTVFAPTNAAFDQLAADLGTTIPGLLALPNLADSLTYHVLGTEVEAADVTNGAVVTPLFTGNTLKLTKTSGGDVFVNHAEVLTQDLGAGNGIVHVIDAVVLSNETVVDVAIDNGFTSLTAAVAEARLLPALTNPFANYTVFAPNNAAFDQLATDLSTPIPGLLALPNLADILTYHVLGTEVEAADVTNGTIVTPLFTGNTLKLTKTTAGDVFVNHAEVILEDVTSSNGIVHVIDQVILSEETVVDIAIDNGFTALVAAVVKAELLPAATNPIDEFTVFAPTDSAFNVLATALGTDLNGILALPNLADILTYHVVSGNVNSGDLVNGPVATVNGSNIIVNLTSGVKINDATVTTPDVEADNGVVHIINKVLLETFLGINSNEAITMDIFPNPAVDVVSIKGINEGDFTVFNSLGAVVLSGKLTNGKIDLSNLSTGVYQLKLTNKEAFYQGRIIKN
ncbi:MAG: fasciclin domain-containing protein [Fluviicola sp.]